MNDWPKVRLGEICEIRKGQAITKRESNPGPYPVILGGREPAYFIDRFNHTGKAMVISRSGASAGYVSRWNEPIFVTDGFLIEPKENCTFDYLYYTLKCKQQQLFDLKRGSAIPHITPSLIATVYALLPPLSIQHAIAGRLAAYDHLIENNRRRIAILERKAEQIYKEWFVRRRFPWHEKAKFTDGLPVGWRKETLENIAEITMGQSPESSQYNTENKGLPFHQGVTGFRQRFPINEVWCIEGKRFAEEGDILFSVRAPVGRINIATEKIVIGRGLSAFRSKDGNQSWLFYLLKDTFRKEDMIGTGSIFASTTKKSCLE